MKKRRSKMMTGSARKGVVLDRKTFAFMSAVEGIRLSREDRDMFARFDRQGLSEAERRERIISRFKRTGTKRG